MGTVVYPQQHPLTETKGETARCFVLLDHFHEKKNKKHSCCCDSRSYCLRRTVYWQTINPVSVTSWRTAGTSIRFNR